jgi:1-acyl-sn-glycerol-3-phosphate acyltransferase
MRWITPAYYWSGRALVRAIIFVVARLEVVGRENMPRQGGLIVASNHLNNADPPVLVSSLPRRLVFMAKQEAFRWPLIGFLVRLSGAFPVRRFEADLGALRQATTILEEDQVLMMFPEGTRSLDTKLGKAHPGTALLALRSGSPILPVAISGSEVISLSKVIFDILRLRRQRIRVVVGQPFFLPSVTRMTAEEVRRCSDVIMERIASLLPPPYRGEYGQAVADSAAEKASEIEGSR